MLPAACCLLPAATYRSIVGCRYRYDLLQQKGMYNHTMFSAAFHLLAMRAGAALARTPSVADEAFAAACDDAFARGAAAIDAQLWNESAGYYRAFVGGPQGAVDGNTSLMSDSLYAQVLADSLGLGALLPDERVTRHQARVLRRNSSPHGLAIQTGRPSSVEFPDSAVWQVCIDSIASRDEASPAVSEHCCCCGGDDDDDDDDDAAVWQMANPNWATLALWRGADVDAALGVAKVTLDNWRSAQNDLWNVAGLAGGAGYGAGGGRAWTTSHYGYYMSSWHLLFALAGQRYDAPSAALSFAPRPSPPYTLPALVPGTAATVAAAAGNASFLLAVVAGAPLRLAALDVNGCAPPAAALPTVLPPGQAVEWSC